MDAVSILFAVGLAVLVGVFIAGPLLGDSRDRAPGADDITSAWRAERESLLTALRELDFDQATGKVADEDYAPQRAALVTRGVAILQQLDALAEKPADSVEAQLETAVRVVRARLSGMESTRLACPRCGAPHQANDRFCAKCGAPLTGAA
jgi:zinc ribbon protein